MPVGVNAQGGGAKDTNGLSVLMILPQGRVGGLLRDVAKLAPLLREFGRPPGRPAARPRGAL